MDPQVICQRAGEIPEEWFEGDRAGLELSWKKSQKGEEGSDAQSVIFALRAGTRSPIGQTQAASPSHPQSTTQRSRFARIEDSMELYIVAGPNGASSTTFAHEFLPRYTDGGIS